MSAPTTHDVLVKARALIDKPEAWTKGALARASTGRRAREDGPGAVCWCVSGAIICANGGQYHRGAFRAFEASLGPNRPVIPHWNDAPERTHAEVLAAFDRAIASSLPDSQGVEHG